ncbi:DUF6114 domain-containing protein [Streptomyces sp. NPDC058052]|uniref:DUF6114 domain-containing protein n=1 Tax=Streptomyces sp. NPDC058052 TaxID=3346316 RepID=UPI0036ED9458
MDLPVPASGRRRAHRGRRRPSGAGVLLALGGAEILLVQRAGPATLLSAGADARYALPLLMCLCGVLVVARARGRRWYGAVGVVASLGSWVASDLGGFVLGMTLGIAGGALALGRPSDRIAPGPRPAG